jgi:hypothetical protein
MLSKKTIAFPFSEMLDQKVDSKSLPLPKLLIAENVRRSKAGKLEKRYGCQALGTRIAEAPETLVDSDALGTYRDELLQFNKQKVYSYAQNAEASVDKGSWVSAITESSDILKNDYDQTYIDLAVVDDIGAYVYLDVRGGIYLTLRDNKSGTLLITDRQLHATATNPRCLAFKGNIYVFYVVGNDLRARIIAPQATSLGSEVIITSAVNSVNIAYDVCAQDNYISCVFNVTAATQIRYVALSSSLAITNTFNIAEAGTVITCFRDSSNRLFIAWLTGTTVRATAYTVLFSIVFAPATVETVSNAVRLTGYALPDATGVRLFYEISAANSWNTLVRTNTVTNAGSIGTAAVFLRSVGLASKAWAYSPDTSDKGFVTVVHSSTLQSTFFVARNDGLIVSKIKYGVAGGLMSINQLPNAETRSTGVYQVPILTKNPVIALGNSNLLSFRGVSSAQIDFTDLRAFKVEELGSNGLVVGGVTGSYDGQSIVEHGFHLFPENITLAQSTGGSLTLLGTYSYKVVWYWTDNLGRIHRSAPSPAISTTMTGSNNRVTVTIPTLRLTQKQGVRTNVVAALFRTESNQVNYYRASSPTSLTYNNPAADTITIVDDLADSVLIGREVLYTTGDIVENIAPPSTNIITIHQKRAFVLDEDGRIWYSKENTAGKPIEFCDQFIIEVDAIGGKCTALSSLDDKLIIFKQNSIAYITGNGPDDRGLAGVWANPEFVTSDIGCIEPNSVVRSSDGILFKSRKGIYLLSRDLQISYVGSAVEDYNSEVITSAVALTDQNEIRFTTVSGPCLVYNYEFKQWSTFTNYVAADAVRWQGQYVYIRKLTGSPDICVVEVPNFYLDMSQPYSQKISMAWAGFANLNGFQRIWRAHLLGDYKSKHQLKVSIAYDFSPVIHDEYYYDAQQQLGVQNYGDLTYGESVFGGIEANFQVRIHIRRQKSQALRLVIEDVAPASPYESFSLSGIAFEIAIKKGNIKLPSVQTL